MLVVISAYLSGYQIKQSCPLLRNLQPRYTRCILVGFSFSFEKREIVVIVFPARWKQQTCWFPASVLFTLAPPTLPRSPQKMFSSKWVVWIFATLLSFLTLSFCFLTSWRLALYLSSHETPLKGEKKTVTVFSTGR